MPFTPELHAGSAEGLPHLLLHKALLGAISLGRPGQAPWQAGDVRLAASNVGFLLAASTPCRTFLDFDELPVAVGGRGLGRRLGALLQRLLDHAQRRALLPLGFS